jgi:AcrR family transcriptional regulator
MKVGKKTKDILLDTACRLFAAQGYSQTTMRDITEAAKTNVAAINYHFGDKENLYFEAYKYAFQIEDDILKDATRQSSKPRELLENTISIRLTGLAEENENSWLMQMFHHEIFNPSAQHGKIVKEVMFKQKANITGVIQEFFEMDLSESQLDVIFSCFLSPMLHQQGHRDRIKKHQEMFPEEIEKHYISDEARINIIKTYIMSGLEGLKKEFKNEK